MRWLLSILMLASLSILGATPFPACDLEIDYIVVDWIPLQKYSQDNPFIRKYNDVDISSHISAPVGEFKVTYRYSSDTILEESRPNSRRVFLIDKKNYKLLSTENNEVIISEDNPPVWSTKDDQQMSISSLNRRVDHRHTHLYKGIGSLCSEYLGSCSVIIDGSRKLDNVEIHRILSTTNYTKPSLYEYPNESEPVDSNITVVEEIISWITKGVDIPLIQSWSTNVISVNDTVVVEKCSAILKPTEFDIILTEQELTQDVENTKNMLNPENLSLNISSGKVNFDYQSQVDIEIEMVLCDILGRVYAVCPRRRIRADESCHFEVDRTSLPMGEYVIYINSGTESIHVNFALK